jgi:hypothetical protein
MDTKLQLRSWRRLSKYISHIRTSNLWEALPELALRGADLLIGFYFDATTPGAKLDRRGADGSWTRSVAQWPKASNLSLAACHSQ